MKKLLVLAIALLLPVAAWADASPPLLTEQEVIAQYGAPDRVRENGEFRELIYGRPSTTSDGTSAGRILLIRGDRWIAVQFFNEGVTTQPESYPRLRDMVASGQVPRAAMGRVLDEPSAPHLEAELRGIGIEMRVLKFRVQSTGMLYVVNCVMRSRNGRRPPRGDYRVWTTTAKRER